MSRAPLLLAVAAAACGGPRAPAPPAPEAPASGYRATVRWTSFGVPHVIADDLGGLGFGQGWATARQHLCRLADELVRVRGERARYFGAQHVDSDFFHLHLGLDARARDLLGRQSEDARAITAGWVAGYNHYVTTTAPTDWPEPCRAAPWVTPIDELDLARLDLALATIASSRAFAAQIAGAAPDTGTALAPLEAPAAVASNAWAIGGDRTESGGGLVVANPHFPWEGELTFSEIHLTVRGDLDVYGAQIPGVPLVGIGFTRHHAWTHTFSSSTRFVLYRLRLVDGDPLRYVRDDGVERLTARTYTIDVRNPDGSLEKVSRTLHASVHGPMIASPATPWDRAQAFSLRDVALESAGSVTDLYLGFARAESLDAFRASLAHRATPFLNTLYADVDGDAWYVDGSAVPSFTDEALAAWELTRRAVPEVGGAWQRRIVVVDGSSSLFDLAIDDPQAPGAIPIGSAPELLRRDYVFNANDSYGYTNPAAPMTGYSPLYGDPTAAPSPRGLANLRALRERGVASGAGADGVWNGAEAAAAMLSNRSFTGEQLREDVLRACRLATTARPPAPKKKKEKKRRPAPRPAVDPRAPLCTRLAEWDLQFDVDSRGAALWRELMKRLAPTGEIPWTVPFDPAAPSTPSGLAVDPMPALADAAAALAAAGFDETKGSHPLGDLQRAAIGRRAPVPGGDGLDGVASVVTWRDWNGSLLPRADRGDALYPINYGTSWVMSVELTSGGPDARVLLTYGPPRAPDSAAPDDDPMILFGRGELRPALFDDEEIRADPNLVVDEISTGGTP